MCLVDDREQLLGGVLASAGGARVRHDAAGRADLDHAGAVLDLVAHGLAHLGHTVGDALFDRQRQDVRGERLEHRRIEVPAGGADGVTGRDDPGPVDPAHVDRLHQRDVEQDASRLHEEAEVAHGREPGPQRPLAVGHRAQGSERGILLHGDQRAGVVRPAHEQVDLHVHQSGEHRDIAQVDLHRPLGNGIRRHGDDPVAFDQQIAGGHHVTAHDVEHPRADEVDGRLRLA